MQLTPSAFGIRAVPSSSRTAATLSDRRKRIVEACVEVLSNGPFSNLKVEDVARRAGMDKRTLYDYIEKKEDLLFLVLVDFVPVLVERVEAARDRVDDPISQLHTMIFEHVQLMTENPHFASFYYRDLPFLPERDMVAIMNMVNHVRIAYIRVFSRIAGLGVQLPTQDSELNANSVLSQIDMLSLRRYDFDGRSSEEIANHLMRTLVSPGWGSMRAAHSGKALS